jgi:hypothetical protein
MQRLLIVIVLVCMALSAWPAGADGCIFGRFRRCRNYKPYVCEPAFPQGARPVIHGPSSEPPSSAPNGSTVQAPRSNHLSGIPELAELPPELTKIKRPIM